MDKEKQLALGLLSGFREHAGLQEWLGRLKDALGKHPSLVGKTDDLDEKWAAWQNFKASDESKALFAQARYRIQVEDKREAADWAAWLPYQRQLCGRGWFIEVSSPIKVVEWKWPLTVAIMGDSRYRETQIALTNEVERGPTWMQVVVRLVQQPADEVGVADILIFPEGSEARNTLLMAGAPVTADLMFLSGVEHNRFAELAADAEELLKLTQANAVLVTNTSASDVALFRALIRELAHDLPIDEALTQALNTTQTDPGLAMLLSTASFVEKSQLSTFLRPLTKRLRQMRPNDRLDLQRKQAWGLPNQLTASEALGALEGKLPFISESMGASAVSAVASAIASAALPPKRRTRGPGGGATSSAIKKDRFLLHKLLALEPTHVAPEKALEAAKRYMLAVHVGPKSEGYIAAEESFPEPPVRAEESGVSLAVVFFEKNSKPEAELRTVFLPRLGASSIAEFEFTVSHAASVFEGWVSVYHNNRILQEGVLQCKVIGAADSEEIILEGAKFSIPSKPRPLHLGLEQRALFGGTLRFESGDHMTAVRGLRAARVQLPGLRAAVEGMEREFNRLPWGEDVGGEWMTSDVVAAGLSIIAQQGWQIREALCPNPLLQDLEQDLSKPLLVYAADSNVRVPLELCYANPQPKSTAKVCPEAKRAASEGHCVEGCPGKLTPRDHVCPMGFWSLSRVLEWRSKDADSRDDPEAVEISNEPSPGHRVLKPLQKVLLGRSSLVENKHSKQLEELLAQQASSWKEVKTWEEWEEAVKESPTLLLLMPHVDNKKNPPLMEIQTKPKDPPGIEGTDVVGKPPQQPLVLLFGCGAATSLVDFQSLPAQFRRKQAAAVIAPVAQVLAEDAPELARTLIEQLAAGERGTRGLGHTLLEARRKLVAKGKLAGILLLSFGDADWLV